jgi:secondary thiamine-phosphate synthase enzyme
MLAHQESLQVRTRARALHPITDAVAAIVKRAAISAGTCTVFIRHTSASLLLSENADPAVGRDLERFMQRIAPDGSPEFEHDTEGPDDMPAHIRTVLAGASLTIPVGAGRLLLGTWQGLYVWEHRTAAHDREVVVTVVGGS